MYTTEDIRKKFEEKGCCLLSEEYISAQMPLKYLSPDGYVRTTSWAKFQSGRKYWGKSRRTSDFMKFAFVKEGYIYEGEDRSLRAIKYKYECPIGHHHSVRMSHWIDGVRCPFCEGVAKLTIEFIRADFKKEGYILLTTVYINSKTKLDCITPDGHKYSISWNNWRTGYRYNKNKITRNLEMVAEDAALYGYTLKSTKYINNKEKLHLVCPRGHDYFVSWDNWHTFKSRCPRCSKTGISIWENTVKLFVRTLDIPFLENDRTIILNPNTNRYVELDLWFPDLNKAIECNSEYWHKNRKHIDTLKQKWCKSNNISLFSVDFNVWQNDIEQCQKRIKNFLN